MNIMLPILPIGIMSSDNLCLSNCCSFTQASPIYLYITFSLLCPTKNKPHAKDSRIQMSYPTSKHKSDAECIHNHTNAFTHARYDISTSLLQGPLFYKSNKF